jgi:hypothetical protein
MSRPIEPPAARAAPTVLSYYQVIFTSAHLTITSNIAGVSVCVARVHLARAVSAVDIGLGGLVTRSPTTWTQLPVTSTYLSFSYLGLCDALPSTSSSQGIILSSHIGTTCGTSPPNSHSQPPGSSLSAPATPSTISPGGTSRSRKLRARGDYSRASGTSNSVFYSTITLRTSRST